MRNPYDELITSTAEDGASTPYGPLPSQHKDEVEKLMDAWLQERHESIESRMFLDRACHILTRILAEGTVSTRTGRSAKTLIRAIKATQQGERAS